MRASTTSVPQHPPGKNTYSPSVPLSVYRELAAELQASQARLNSLHAQNQQLAIQNQQLGQEIEKVVQHVLRLQHIVNQVDVYDPQQLIRPKPKRPGSSSRSRYHAQPVTAYRPASKNVFTQVEEVESNGYRRRSQPEKIPEVGGWKLAIAILLVIFTAFGAGYLLVRPLLSSR